MALTNIYDHKNNYKEIFEELVNIKELTNETNQNDLTFYFKGNTLKKI